MPAEGQRIAAHNDRKFKPELFTRLVDGDGLALIQRCRALRRELLLPWWTVKQSSAGVY